MSGSAPHTAYFRYYGSLTDFRGGPKPGSAETRYSFWGKPAIKDAIEAQGVPHPEVDLILVNANPVSFEYALSGDDRVSVYPWIQSLPRPSHSLRPPLPTPPRFVCDVHLGQLARYLRMLGFDTHYERDHSDAALARLSDEEGRVLLTRDIELLKRGRVQLGTFVRSQAPRRQLVEMVDRLDLDEDMRPLSRCLECNSELQPASTEAVEEQVPPRARRVHDEYVQCPACRSVYWPGTHVERMQQLIATVTAS